MTSGRIAILALWMAGWGAAQSDSGADQGTVQGTVKDGSGSAVAGAVVTLKGSAERTAITDQTGSFRFAPVEAGRYKISVSALGFAIWSEENVAVAPGKNPVLSAVLEVALASSSVNVTLAQHELAAEQLKSEEKQRLLGVFPDFFVSYTPNPVPLTAAQKFQLGWKTIIDPISFLGTGIAAGIQQGRNNYPEFGQGVEGYAKRFGAQYADRVSHVLVERVFMQSIFHQDPRYFYKGTGSFGSRALYAIGTAFVRKGDNGQWQPDYTDVLGGLAAGEISTLYYPTSSRPVRRLFDNVALGFGGRAANNLVHEFVFKAVTTHVPKIAAGLSRTLPEGTPVSLISLEDWNAQAANGVPVTFLLARDVQVDGVTVAPIGSKASGQANFDGNKVALNKVRLKIGELEVPLRSTPLRDGVGALEYHRIENSGRIAITLYVAGTVTLPAGK